MNSPSADRTAPRAESSDAIYEFGGFRLDTRRRLLYAAGATEPLRLADRAIDTLSYLVEHRGELVGRDELMKAVWPHVVVEDNNLERQISLLRRALGEAPGENRFIATVSGRGYRFVAAVERAQPSDAPVRASVGVRTRRIAVAAIAFFGALALAVSWPLVRRAAPFTSASGSRPSVAVMLCANLTGDAAKDVLAESVARDLIRLLARNSGLGVLSAATSFSFRDSHVDPRALARETNVTHVLECSLQRSQEGLRLAVELGDGVTGMHLWSDSYGLGADIVNRQGLLAAAVAQRVAPGIQAAPTAGLLDGQATAQRVSALDYFAQANGLVGATESRLRKAHELYTLAAERDPSFAPAFAARATTRLVQVSFGYVPAEAIRDAEQDARKAVELDTRLAEARATLAMVYVVRGRWIDAEREMQQAVALDDKNWSTLSRRALLMTTVGRLQDAYKLARRAHEELAPLAMPAMMRRAIALSVLGDDARAMPLVDSVLLMGGITTAGEVSIMQALAALRSRRPADAADLLQPVLPPSARARGADAVIAQVLEAAAAGKPLARAQAAEALRALRDELSIDGLDRSHGQLLMLLHALSGDLDSAFAAAQHVLDYFATADAVGPWYYFLWLPELAAMRRDERFTMLIERLRLADYWREYGPPDVEGCDWRHGALHCA